MKTILDADTYHYFTIFQLPQTFHYNPYLLWRKFILWLKVNLGKKIIEHALIDISVVEFYLTIT